MKILIRNIQIKPPKNGPFKPIIHSLKKYYKTLITNILKTQKRIKKANKSIPYTYIYMNTK